MVVCWVVVGVVDVEVDVLEGSVEVVDVVLGASAVGVGVVEVVEVVDVVDGDEVVEVVL